MLSRTNKGGVAVVVVIVSLIAILGNTQAADATEGTQYCGIIESTTGDKVATGFFYTDEGGRQYCSQIHDPANYVCMTSDGQLPTRTETTTQTILRRSEVVYTFRHVVWRVVPDSSTFKPSGRYDPYAENIGSLSRPVWQYPLEHVPRSRNRLIGMPSSIRSWFRPSSPARPSPLYRQIITNDTLGIRKSSCPGLTRRLKSMWGSGTPTSFTMATVHARLQKSCRDTTASRARRRRHG